MELAGYNDIKEQVKIVTKDTYIGPSKLKLTGI